VSLFLIYGTFMRGQPGHVNLDGGRFLEEARTAGRYRLWHVDGRWPALIPDADGIEIAAELYDLDTQHLARLAEVEPPGWARGPVHLADGRSVEAFLGDPSLRERATDVSDYGGWASFVSRGRGS
jgi:allophanate hydrolase